MRKNSIIAVFILLISLGGCGGDDLGKEGVSSESVPGSELAEKAVEPTKTPPPPPSKIFVVQSAARRSTLTGFTRARSSMTLVTEESGRVDIVVADVGDTIGADGLFAKLDTTFIQLDLESNRADQQRLQSDLNYNKKEMERYRQLVKTKNAAQSTLDSNIRAHQTALQQLRSKQIEERVLEERLKRFSLVGPSGWKVVTRYVEPGEWVTKGEKVAELGRYDVLLVPFSLTSGEYRALKENGDSVTLHLTDLNTTVEAKLARVSPGFDPQTRKINVDLEIGTGSFEFRGGLRAELMIDLPDPGGAVLVPPASLVKAYEEYFLITPDRERVRVVLLGSTEDGMRRVTSPDVQPGDSFLLTP